MNDEAKENQDFCRACREIISSDATICSQCGTPINKFSHWTHVHRSAITTISYFIGLIGIGFVVWNLITAQKMLKLQTTSFIEAYQPRIDLQAFHRIHGDSLEIKYVIKNVGGSDATQIKGNMYAYTISQRLIKKRDITRNILVHDNPENIPLDLPGIYKQDFKVTIDFDYFWNGERQKKHFNETYYFKYNESNRGYDINIVPGTTFIKLTDSI